MPQLGIGQRQDVVAGDAALGEPQQHRARAEAAALAGALEQAGALERADQAARGGLWETRHRGQFAHGQRLGRFDHAHQQLSGAIGGLGPGLCEH